MKTLITLSAAAMLVAGTAMAENALNWDSDKDGMISADEYNSGMESDTTFTAWDADGDGMLSADEFRTGNWKAFDSDADGMWNEEEAGFWMDTATRSGREVSQ